MFIGVLEANFVEIYFPNSLDVVENKLLATMQCNIDLMIVLLKMYIFFRLSSKLSSQKQPYDNKKGF